MGRKRADRGPQGAAEADLVTAIAHFRHDPLGFVMFTWDWGQGELAGETGPDKWQIRVLHALGEASRKGEKEMAAAVRIAVASGHGVGKALSNRTIVPTPDGDRRWGDILPGDRLFGSDGKPTVVTARYDQGDRPIYRVTFDDGTSVEADADHLWKVRGRQERRNGDAGWRTMTTAQISAAGIKRPNGRGDARQWEIPAHGAVEYPWAWTPVDPYTMGAWLGDGTRLSGTLTSADPEVARKIRRAGYHVEVKPVPGNAASKVTVKGLPEGLRATGVWESAAHEKAIPKAFKENLTEVRAEVLRGLLDTDGTVTPTGCIQFCSVSRQLAEDVAWLARSLGGKARMGAPRPSHHRNAAGEKIRGRDHYIVSLTMPDGFRAFEIERKQAKVRATTQKRYLARWIESIEYIGIEEAMCVTVDAPDALFLANDFIVTHNTTLICWIICWFISTRSDPQIVVTANTATQLETKTWRELAKWWRLAINQSWFQWTATKFYLKDRPETHFAAAIPWSPQRAQSFAGTHEKKGVLILFDEASTIDDIIWETIEGAFTTAGAFFLAFGNPTQNTGRFRECWTRFKKRWLTFQVDSREAKVANQEQIKQWIEDYTEDSDFVRVRVKGMFPRASSTQFISTEEVETAQKRQEVIVGNMPTWMAFPIVVGVDVARYGDDQSVILVRQGPKIHRIRRFEGLDTVQVTYRVIETVKEIQEELDATVEGIFVDEGGVGAGVIDPLIAQGYDQAYGVQFGAKALDNKTYFNRVAEMWWDMRKAIRKDLMLPAPETTEGKDLQNDLIGRQYGFDGPGRIQLESKEDMKKRGQSSPDIADALALTYAAPVIARETETSIQKKLALIAHGMDDGGTSHMAY